MTKLEIIEEIGMIIQDEVYSPGRYSEGVRGQKEAAKRIYEEIIEGDPLQLLFNGGSKK